MSDCCRQFIISGKVQGVWYRATAQKFAQALDLLGYAKNLDNGNVEVIACGSEEALQEFEEKLWQGSPLAKVTKVEKSDVIKKDFSDFSTY